MRNKKQRQRGKRGRGDEKNRATAVRKLTLERIGATVTFLTTTMTRLSTTMAGRGNIAHDYFDPVLVRQPRSSHLSPGITRHGHDNYGR